MIDTDGRWNDEGGWHAVVRYMACELWQEHSQKLVRDEITPDRVRRSSASSQASGASASAEDSTVAANSSDAASAAAVPLCPPCWDTPGKRSDTRGKQGTMLCRAAGCKVGACGLGFCSWCEHHQPTIVLDGLCFHIIVTGPLLLWASTTGRQRTTVTSPKRRSSGFHLWEAPRGCWSCSSL